jgi:hypothetical protein
MLVHTRYFKDQLAVRMTLGCGKDRKLVTSGPELSVSLKSNRIGNESTYACVANPRPSKLPN